MTSKTLVAVVMAANGSPAPLFESDDDRLSFVIRLACHPLVVGKMTPTAQVTEQVTAQVTGEVQRLLGALVGEMSRQQLLDALGMTHGSISAAPT
jgi:ATP-dependent DNA helicase RecG